MERPSDLEQPAAGDTEAQFALAAKLLALPDSPDSFARGAALVEAAAASGHAEATCLLATLEAVGAGRRRDWTRAFECLERAAERGSEHARARNCACSPGPTLIGCFGFPSASRCRNGRGCACFPALRARPSANG